MLSYLAELSYPSQFLLELYFYLSLSRQTCLCLYLLPHPVKIINSISSWFVGTNSIFGHIGRRINPLSL